MIGTLHVVNKVLGVLIAFDNNFSNPRFFRNTFLLSDGTTITLTNYQLPGRKVMLREWLEETYGAKCTYCSCEQTKDERLNLSRIFNKNWVVSNVQLLCTECMRNDYVKSTDWREIKPMEIFMGLGEPLHA